VSAVAVEMIMMCRDVIFQSSGRAEARTPMIGDSLMILRYAGEITDPIRRRL